MSPDEIRKEAIELYTRAKAKENTEVEAQALLVVALVTRWWFKRRKKR